MNKRMWLAVLLLLVSLVAWVPSSNVIRLIIENDPVILGRYSVGHFGGLLLLTIVLWIAVVILFSTRKKSTAETVFALVMVYVSTIVSGFVLVIGSGMVNSPRFVEKVVSGVDQDTGMVLSGVVRHRPPNERFELEQKDVPERLRSYPNAPAGYPAFPLVLTSDSKGFRNHDQLSQYDMLVVGDSFVAGSHVSDEQAWVDLLRKSTGKSIYNLGVSGSDPLTYLNNFITLGRSFKPQTVLVMLYEGNDFRDAPPMPKKTPAAAAEANTEAQSAKHSMAFYAKASPVTKGLRRVTEEVLAQVGRDWAVPGYQEAVGFMPIALPATTGTQHYSFEPKRLQYLAGMSEQVFAQSSDWNNVRDVLDAFVTLSQKDGFRLLFVYAPSTPHVVLPLAEKNIPAQQLQNFMRIKYKTVEGDAETYKQQVFARLDSNENTWRNWCQQRGVECISTTKALREAVAAGQQIYYTYDQHWTPEGNAVTAAEVAAYLRAHPVAPAVSADSLP